MSTQSEEIAFPALQGSSLIGYMAALGAFRTLASIPENRQTTMRWLAAGGSYYPVVKLPGPAGAEKVVQTLHTTFHASADHYVTATNRDLKIPRANFQKLAKRAAEDYLEGNDREAVGMVAAFGCDAVGGDDGMIEDTAFRTMSGAGHQHFLEFMNLLARETTAEQLHEALFGPWRYRDASPTMRWDAEDDRRYALRWDEPSKDPVRTVRGANLLATAALPLFPVVPVSSKAVVTTAFSGRGSRDTFVSWPIWNGWLSLDVIRALLSQKEFQSRGNSSAKLLDTIGVVAIYRSQRITLGKYRNFTPASCM